MQAPTDHRAISAQDFRSQATGCSPCVRISREQGAARAAEAMEYASPKVKRAIAPAQGYPTQGEPKDLD
jgi:hypothetical protein